MDRTHSITQWIAELRRGDAAAAEALWQAFFVRLAAKARSKFRLARRVADEEDAALEALGTVFRRAQAGEYPGLRDRDGLWRLLLAVAERKVLNLERGWRRQKRGGGRVRGESALGRRGETGPPRTFDDLPAPAVTDALAGSLGGVLQQLLAELDEPLAEVAQLKLAGLTNAQIAAKIDRAIATVERRLKMIRDQWRLAADGRNPALD
jgi:DNA-directed RNA polymerase specialized sigma24 family protein